MSLRERVMKATKFYYTGELLRLIERLVDCAHELSAYKCEAACPCDDCAALTALTRELERLEGE